MTLFVVRSARTAMSNEGRIAGPGEILCVKGEEDAEVLGRLVRIKLGHQALSRLVVPNTVRGLHTGTIIADMVGFSGRGIEVEPRLAPRGINSTMYGHLAANMPWDGEGQRWYDIEPRPALNARVLEVVQDIEGRGPDDTTLIVSHASGLRPLYKSLGMPQIPLDHDQVLVIPNNGPDPEVLQ